MLSRSDLVSQLLSSIDADSRVVTALGYLSREFFWGSTGDVDRCFFCYGSMGGVIPFSLGLATACPNLTFYAVEGDGSLIMSLGSLVTAKRYGRSNLRILIADNGCFESTGGQPSQPSDFSLARIIESVGFRTAFAHDEKSLHDALHTSITSNSPNVIVISMTRTSPRPLVPLAPELIAERFGRTLRSPVTDSSPAN